ncbi:hypothetical protein C5B42_00680 [Candidatus Cerribacteria bacterium 'Amazon FNV 2010 28 9']|uniref:Uncharacterized protein n=1 Tax=Candidatus Cerribacteria bacterium 'Amazon FNV 2010 28 9' TaxID=2081795 RepID=A0A317JPT8_9BACT|nr:MAG: hypothetical protein C5B42_00680 [Candidatus Cerribacteria bacterium 'Amazon FNV 2010 28 9']
MTIKQFLSRHVEGYLFKDLRTMMRVKLRKGQKIGGVGYPVVASILAGMEMLGGILQNGKGFKTTTSTTKFFHYWNNFFIKDSPKYSDYGNAFWKLIRNGVSHTYLTKTGIWVIRGNSSEHLRIYKDGSDYYLMVDIYEFFTDFVNSYNNQVRPIVYKGQASSLTTPIMMKKRLDEMIRVYKKESNSVLSKIQPQGNAPQSLPPNFWSAMSNASTVPSGVQFATYSGTVIKTN